MNWIEENLQGCFQLMESNDRQLLDKWIVNWSDIVKFEMFLNRNQNENISFVLK